MTSHKSVNIVPVRHVSFAETVELVEFEVMQAENSDIVDGDFEFEDTSPKVRVPRHKAVGDWKYDKVRVPRPRRRSQSQTLQDPSQLRQNPNLPRYYSVVDGTICGSATDGHTSPSTPTPSDLRQLRVSLLFE